MVSLFVVIAGVVSSLVLTAWATAAAARAVGSRRGRFGVGLAAVGVLAVASVALTVAVAQLPPEAAGRPAVVAAASIVAQLSIAFVVLRYAFALGPARAVAPFAAYLGMTVGWFLLTLFVLKPFVVEAFVLPSKSMSPTLEPGDRISVAKVLSPRRLDLIAYRVTAPQPTVYCKRVIGLPGERLRFDGGWLFVNDRPVPLPPSLAGRCHAAPRTAPPQMARYHDGETITLGPDELFVIGDNVDLSADSRLSGPVRRSAVVGVADLIYWPAGRVRVLR